MDLNISFAVLSPKIRLQVVALVKQFYLSVRSDEEAAERAAQQLLSLNLPLKVERMVVIQRMYNLLLTRELHNGKAGVRQILERLSWITPLNIKMLVQHIQHYYYPNNFGGGLNLLYLALSVCPDVYALRALLGDFLRKQHSYQDSLTAYRRAEELYDASCHISLFHIRIGMVYVYLELARSEKRKAWQKSYLECCQEGLALCQELWLSATGREKRRFYQGMILLGIERYKALNNFDSLCQAKMAVENLQSIVLTERSKSIISQFNHMVELATTQRGQQK